MSPDEFHYTTVGDLEAPRPRWPGPLTAANLQVVAVGAWCCLQPMYSPDPGRNCLSIRTDEFAELSDGSRVSIRWDRGVTASWNSDDQMSEREALIHLDGGLLPDEGEVDDDGEARSWHEYARLLQAMGIKTTAGELKSLPYVTEFSPELRANLSH